MYVVGTELCIQLLGGQHRLSANNTHQLPLAVFLCGFSRSAVYGLSAARHLAGHGVRTQECVQPSLHFSLVIFAGFDDKIGDNPFPFQHLYYILMKDCVTEVELILYLWFYVMFLFFYL